MSELQEVKELFTSTEKKLEALRSDFDDLKGKQADYIDQDRQRKMADDLAAQFSAEQKAMAERLDKLETAGNRPGAAGKSEDEIKAAKLFNDYLRKGVEADEFKAMATSQQDSGGFLVSNTMEAGIRARLRRTSPVRAVANVISGFSGGSYEVLVERGDSGYEWAGEKSSRSETTTPTIDRISIALHELSAMPKVTQRLLDNADYDIEGWLEDRIADRFARAEATAFVSGDGVNKPKGFLSYSTATTADESRAAETLQYRGTGTSGGFDATNPANVLIQTFYDLQGQYQANATWMMKNITAAQVATIQDDNGYLLRGVLNGEGSIVRTIQGRPLEIADDMPVYTGAGALGIAVGDFTAGYTIIDGKNVTVLRDPYSAKPHVLFYTTKRVGGGVTEFDAIKLIKFS